MKSEERSRWLLVLGVPLGVLSGLLGLSGTEYRAPFLRAFFRYPAERIVPFNLTISVMTLGGAIVGRESSTSAALLSPYLVELVSIVVGTIFGVYVAGRVLDRFNVNTTAIARWMIPVFVLVGLTLMLGAVKPLAVLPAHSTLRAGVGVALGFAIGAVSSALRISGGKLLIPALILAFGVDVKLAGTASACVSFPIVLTGLVRHTREQGYVREREYRELVIPMGVGSALGAVTGGLMLSRVPPFILTLTLGALLVGSAIQVFQLRNTE